MYVQHQEGFTHPDLVFPHPTTSLGDSFLNPKKGEAFAHIRPEFKHVYVGKGPEWEAQRTRFISVA